VAIETVQDMLDCLTEVRRNVQGVETANEARTAIYLLIECCTILIHRCDSAWSEVRRLRGELEQARKVDKAI
jgi:hypothetical protein